MEHVARLREQLQCGGIDGAINWLRHTTEIVPDYSDMVDFMPDALTTWLWAVQHATMLGPLSIGDISHRVYEFYDALEPMMDCWCSRVGPTIDLLIDYCVVLECSQFTVMLEYAGALLLRVACNSADPNFVEAFESVYAAFFGTASDRLTKFEFFMPRLTSAVRSTGIMAVQSNAVFVRHTHTCMHMNPLLFLLGLKCVPWQETELSEMLTHQVIPKLVASAVNTRKRAQLYAIALVWNRLYAVSVPGILQFNIYPQL